jgi:hypothetical protein
MSIQYLHRAEVDEDETAVDQFQVLEFGLWLVVHSKSGASDIPPSTAPNAVSTSRIIVELQYMDITRATYSCRGTIRGRLGKT